MKILIFILTLILCAPSSAYTGEDYCLAQNIWHEARGEVMENDLSPWLLVAFVTINRVNTKDRWGDNVCAVVWEPSQFSWTHDALPDEILPKDDAEAKLWEEILHFSHSFLRQYEQIVDPTRGSNHYHAERVSPDWAKRMKKKVKIGRHIAYLDKK